MKEGTKTTIAVCLSLMVGFISGSAWKGTQDKREFEKTSATLPMNSAVPRNSFDRAGGPLARNVPIDPAFVPDPLPIVATLVPKMMTLLPKTKTVETERDVRVIAKLPGLDEKQVTVAVAPDAVSISGKLAGDSRKSDVVNEEFAETIPLGVKVDATKAQAAFKDGELTVVIPKAGKGIAQRSDKGWH